MKGLSDAVLAIDMKAGGDKLAGKAFENQFFDRTGFDQFFWDKCAEGEDIGFDLLSGAAANIVKVGRGTAFGHVKKEVAEFVKEHGESCRSRQSAVDGDNIAAHQTKIKALRVQRRFDDGDVKPFAEAKEICFV